MEWLEFLSGALAEFYGSLHPDKEAGLSFGILGGAACLLSVLLYTPRRRFPLLQGCAPKRYWLNLHMILGLFGPLMVLPHATVVWLGFPGLANVAMWITVFSGVVARYFTVRVPLAKFKREMLLEILAGQARPTRRKLRAILGPDMLNRVNSALDDRFISDENPSLLEMVRQFFRDLRVIGILTLHALGMRLRNRRVERARRARNGRRNTHSPPDVLISYLVLKRNLTLLNIQEAGAPFWIQLHIAFSFGFFLALVGHLVGIYLFKPQYLLW